RGARLGRAGCGGRVPVLPLSPHGGRAGAFYPVPDLPGIAVAGLVLEVDAHPLLALPLQPPNPLFFKLAAFNGLTIQSNNAALLHFHCNLIGHDDVFWLILDLLRNVDGDIPQKDRHRDQKNDEQHENDVDKRCDVDVALRLACTPTSGGEGHGYFASPLSSWVPSSTPGLPASWRAMSTG